MMIIIIIYRAIQGFVEDDLVLVSSEIEKLFSTFLRALVIAI